MTSVQLDTSKIVDWGTFHQVFAELFGFLDVYGRNLDAWIDCMSYLDDPDGGMSQVTVSPGEILLLEVRDTEGFRRRCPEQFQALIECSAFVNLRRREVQENPVLGLVLV